MTIQHAVVFPCSFFFFKKIGFFHIIYAFLCFVLGEKESMIFGKVFHNSEKILPDKILLKQFEKVFRNGTFKRHEAKFPWTVSGLGGSID